MGFPMEVNDGTNEGMYLTRKMLKVIKEKYLRQANADIWKLTSLEEWMVVEAPNSGRRLVRT